MAKPDLQHRQAVPSATPAQDADTIEAGALVVQKGHDIPLVVEAIRETSFGTLAQCCGFQTQNRLWIEDIPVSQLEQTSKPHPIPDMMEGLNVRLRPAGPVMTILDLHEEDGISRAVCEWDGPAGIVRQRAFPVTSLILGLLDEF